MLAPGEWTHISCDTDKKKRLLELKPMKRPYDYSSLNWPDACVLYESDTPAIKPFHIGPSLGLLYKI